MHNDRKVIVIGGGIIGTACAYYLSRDGWHVTLLEQGEFGKGCSHGNCGFVSPSHVLPLASPGAIRMALGSLFTPDSPFYVKPRFDLRLISWMLQFARRCNHRDMVETGRAIQALLVSSRKLYEELLRDEAMDCEWETRGAMFVFQTARAMAHHAPTDELLRETFHVSADRLDGETLSEMEPALKPGLAGAWHYRGDAHLRPDRLLASWRLVLEGKGVAIHEDCKVMGFAKARGRANAVVTDKEAINADAFVVATGAWTPLLETQLGWRIPIQPGKGYSITMKTPSLCARHPLLFEEHRVAVTPMRTGYRLGSMMEFAGYDAVLDRRRLEVLKRGAAHYLREQLDEPIQEEWFGWRPMTPDGKPILDRCPYLRNVYIAAGHNMLGMSMAPATGKLIAELLSAKAPHVDPRPYALRRL